MSSPIHLTSVGLLDTNIIVLREWIPDHELPHQMAISTITLAELTAGINAVKLNTPDGLVESSRRVAILGRAENEFEPLPFDSNAARIYGRIYAATIAAGRNPRGRTADLMIAAIAAANSLPLYTANPKDFVGLNDIVQIIAVNRPKTSSK